MTTCKLKWLLVTTILIIPILGLAQNDILKKSDDSFFPKVAKFTLTMKLYEKNKYRNYYEIDCYIEGPRKYLAVFRNPPIVRKQAHLRVENNIWHYLGKIKKSIRISAKANFSGSVFSEEDILSTSLAYFYNLDHTEEIVLEGIKTIKLTLLTKSKNNAYSKIEMFIDAETFVPIKRYYYSYSGLKIKEMIVKDIKMDNGKLKYAEITMVDLLRNGRYTEIIFDNIQHLKDIPDRMFTKKYMEIASE